VFFAHFATFAVGVKTATAKYAKIAKKSLEDPITRGRAVVVCYTGWN